MLFIFSIFLYSQSNMLDNTFGTSGTVRNFILGGDSTNDNAYAVAIQPDRKIVLAGGSADNFGNIHFALARLNINGILGSTGGYDASFGINGTATTHISGSDGTADKAYSMAVEPDGTIVLAGRASLPGSISRNAFAVACFDSNGTLDKSFGTNGSATVNIWGGDSTDDRAYAVAIQADGKIVVAGNFSGTKKLLLIK